MHSHHIMQRQTQVLIRCVHTYMHTYMHDRLEQRSAVQLEHADLTLAERRHWRVCTEGAGRQQRHAGGQRRRAQDGDGASVASACPSKIEKCTVIRSAGVFTSA